jgi:hypothetical protein
MRSRDEPDPVKPALMRAEAELAHHLDEACEEIEQKDLSQESMDELLRLEDDLLSAARALREAVRLRRRLGEQPKTEADSEGSADVASAASPEEAAGSRLREFADAEGKEWRVWEVRPGSSGRKANPERYLGEYFKGWLAFESLEGDVRKRLPNHPADWFRANDAELQRLLPRAIEVPKRKPRASAADTP